MVVCDVWFLVAAGLVLLFVGTLLGATFAIRLSRLLTG
jgi:hypothetical protein